LLQLTSSSGLRAQRSQEDKPYHFKKVQGLPILKHFIACPPVTSEAGASRPKSLAGTIFYVLLFYLLLYCSTLVLLIFGPGGPILWSGDGTPSLPRPRPSPAPGPHFLAAHVHTADTGCPVKIRLSSFKYNFFCDRTIFKNLILK
jgi:hypothetical protein